MATDAPAATNGPRFGHACGKSLKIHRDPADFFSLDTIHNIHFFVTLRKHDILSISSFVHATC
jgi:hypothetical protein